MPQINSTFQILSFDAKGYGRAVKRNIEAAFKDCIRKFVMVAAPRVPVQTGMARGSFLNIGRLVNYIVPISPQPRRNKNGTKKDKVYYHPDGRRFPKTPRSGALLSTPMNDIMFWKGTKLVFNFRSDVFHLTLQDFFHVKSPTSPWRSFQEGQVAFVNAFKANRGMFPNLGEYITVSTVSAGRGSGLRSSGRVRFRKQQRGVQ